MQILRSLRALLAATALLSPALSAQRYHVDAAAGPAGDGLTWQAAFDSLDDALAVIVPGDRIWVAEGLYTPSVEQEPGDPRSVTFLVPAGVWMYGGFLGFEQTLDARAGSFDATVLSGEIGGPGLGDNAYHVVHVRHPSGIPPGGNRIDGFRIRRGNATNGAAQGGGVKAWNVGLRLENVTLEDNGAYDGAGVHAQPGGLRLANCVVRGNRATHNGGGLWSHAANIKAFNTRFEGNSAANKGGGVSLNSSGSTFENVAFGNCVFFENRADIGAGVLVGGGAFSYGIATFKSCTFARNRATTRGGGLRAGTSALLPARVFLYNSIVWGNQAPAGRNTSGRLAVASCDIQGGGFSASFGNLDVEPLFVDLNGGDLRLAPGSPCADAGDNGLAISDYLDLDDDSNMGEPVPYDFDSNARFQDDPNAPNTGSGSGPLIDMGAFERRSS